MAFKVLKLKKTSDYKKLSSNCRRQYSKNFIFLHSPNILIDPDSIRVGLTVSKKIGKAVLRNKCKRIIRALLKEVLPSSHLRGIDMNIIAKVNFLSQDYSRLKKEMLFSTKKIKEKN